MLIEGLLKDVNPVIRASAAHGLMLVGPKTIRTLLLALHDKDPKVIKAVATAIEKIGLAAIIETIKVRPRKQRESIVASAKEVLHSPFPLGAAIDILNEIIRQLDGWNSPL